MHILIVSNIFSSRANPHGGSFVMSRVAAMQALGITVQMVGVGATPFGREDLRPDQMLDATVGVRWGRRVHARITRHVPTLEVETARRVAESVDISDVDAVMAHGMFTPAAGTVAKMLAFSTGVPYSVHLHGSDVNVVLPRSPKPFLSTLDVARVNIFVSHALLRAAQISGYQGVNYQVIPNGVDPAIFSRSLEVNRGNPSTNPTFLFVGNLLRVKGADRLPGIFKRLHQTLPTARFVVIGDGPLLEPLTKATRNLPVEYVGRVPQAEVARAMAAASMLLLPSRSEGWPTVINESYAVGTPVVAADVGGIREAVCESNCLVGDGNAFEQRFATRVLEMLGKADPEALARRANSFTWEALVRSEVHAVMGTCNGI